MRKVAIVHRSKLHQASATSSSTEDAKVHHSSLAAAAAAIDVYAC